MTIQSKEAPINAITIIAFVIGFFLGVMAVSITFHHSSSTEIRAEH